MTNFSLQSTGGNGKKVRNARIRKRYLSNNRTKRSRRGTDNSPHLVSRL